jgi:hypothetical protein
MWLLVIVERQCLLVSQEVQEGTNSDGATLYFDSNGLYLSTTLDLTSQILTQMECQWHYLEMEHMPLLEHMMANSLGIVSYTYIPGCTYL